MKKNNFRKFLTSAAIITTTTVVAFAINASNEKSPSQNNNTASYKSIYAQQVGQKPTFTKTTIQPTTTTSTDGEVTYTLTNFDPNKMTLSLVAGSGGTLGTYDPQTRKVKVTGLANGQYGQIMVSLKQTPAASITKSMFGWGVDDEDTNSAGMVKKYAWAYDSFTLDTTSTISFDFIAKSWKTPTKKPSYNDIIKNGQYSKHFKGDMVFDKATQKWTYNGKNAEDYKVTDSIFFLWSKDSKNNPFKNQIRIWVDYDISTKKLTFNYDLSFGETAGENNVAVTQFNVKTHKQISFWKDGTALSQHSSKFTPAQTYVGISTKPTFTKTTIQPTTTTSTDGEVTYTLTNFDPNKMTLSLVAGSGGTLGTYDPQTRKVKVTGLKVGQHAQIQVTPNSGEAWTDGTKTAQKSSTFQTYRVIIKPTITKEVKLPTTKTSTDGEVTYTLTNFDPNKMIIALAPGANGILGKYDPQTKQIKITGLANGQVTQIQFTLKNKNDVWTDGKKIATIGLEKIKIVSNDLPLALSNDLPLALIIPLSVLGALIIISLIYSQKFYFSFKTMQKVNALNWRIFKTRIRLLGLKFINALFKSK